MKLASLKAGGRDGTLIVVSRDLQTAVIAKDIAPTLQAALENWEHCAPRLNALSEALNAGQCKDAFALDTQALAAPLPRAYEFVDGSAYLPHVERVRRARGASVPESFYSDPLMYHAVGAGFYGPRDPVRVADEAYGIDLEAEVVVVTDDVPMGVSAQDAEAHIQLIGLVNDVSLRNLIPDELAKGFGFLQSKPRSALSPVFVTPDELGDAWTSGLAGLPVQLGANGRRIGLCDGAQDQRWPFGLLLARAAAWRGLNAGSVVAGGELQCADGSRGHGSLHQRRRHEAAEIGAPRTPLLRAGGNVRADVRGRDGTSVFGAIDLRLGPPAAEAADAVASDAPPAEATA